MKIPRKLLIVVLISVFSFSLFAPTLASASGSAGLYTYFQTSKYRIDIVNIHSGPAGPTAGNRNHTNIHVYEYISGAKVHKANYHIAAWTSGTNICWAIFDDLSNQEWKGCNGGLSISQAKADMQAKLIDLLNQETFWEITGTVALAAGVIIVVWAFWPASAIGLATL